MPTKPIHKPKLAEESIENKHLTSNASVGGSLDNIRKDTLSTLWNQLLGGAGKTAGEQVLNPFFGLPHGGDLRPGEATSLHRETKPALPRTEAHMEYFRGIKNADIAPKMQEDASIAREVNEIRMEIKKLVSESKQIETTFKSFQVEQKIVKAGVYHQTFLAFLKSLIHSARISLKEGSSWLNTAKSKKQQRQYQSMAKKHGTSFTLNNERTVATQTG